MMDLMPDSFRHEALTYAGTRDFVPTCKNVLHEGLERGSRLLVLARQDKIDPLAEALGDAASCVTFMPLDRVGRNPHRLINLLDGFQADGRGRHCLGISEPVLAGRPSRTLLEAQLAEFALNAARVAVWPMTLVCTYDRTALAPDALARMRQSHAVIRGEAENPGYLPDGNDELYHRNLDPAPHGAERWTIGPRDLVRMREVVRRRAESDRLHAERIDDLVLAANEIVTNSIRHGGGECRLAIWADDVSLICEARDSGHIDDPFVGRFPPSRQAVNGRGVWLAHHLCDLVQIRSSPAGTTVRLVIDR